MTPRKETAIATRQAVINMRENGMRGTEIAMKMLPELENCEEDPDRFRSGPSSLQSSISKRANSTRKSLIGITDGVQQRLQSGHNNMQRINEEEVVSSDEAPREANLNENSERRSKQRCSTHQSAPSETQWSEWSSRVERLESALHRNYYTIAYSIVLIAYLAGFAEYLYFRLTSIINPEHLVFHPPCEGKANRKIGKDGFHYGVSICAFIGIAVFQLMCFFGLTISEKWTNVKSGSSRRRQSTPEDEQREEFADFIRTKISSTMYRVFACYAICSIINCAIIFYMVGIQDSLGDIVSTILLYVFDALVIIYFIAFPLTTAIYHPYVHCLTRRGAAGSKFILPAISNPNDVKTKSSTLESHINDSDLKSDVEPRNVSLLGQHVTQNVGEVPVLENYLHSPRRVAQRSVETGGATSTSNQPRFSTLV